ncbi:hypothetical protein DMA12_10950 [Amycolatopsis balhimycina DSM 5908]|uniref:SRPBCC family protein n=1 Tax=Amycolatopsis balhimycina DSM 5908 TaxID=1081091 RepID=A0A428WUI5_AMYBA|nr:hypothetical protein [Amycolatopsis balhimycina]RSM46743.1 hypothetical protein DMA12_10950 [Amycolatopsis balhimycina DSM 5908]
MRPKALYVETVIRTDLDTLWQHTQDPALHRRWDLRFTEISPLEEPEGHFRYASRFLGITVAGVGVSAATRDWPDGSRTSVLRFASADPLSLISTGAGFWRYTPVPGGVRFVTGFDYGTRWGRFGRWADRVFRPVFGWMTAWSFDRLRLWLETGVSPEDQPLTSPSAGRCGRTRPRDQVTAGASS